MENGEFEDRYMTILKSYKKYFINFNIFKKKPDIL